MRMVPRGGPILVRQLGFPDVDDACLLVSEDQQHDPLALVGSLNGSSELRGVPDSTAVHLEYHIVSLDVFLRSRAVRIDVVHHDALALFEDCVDVVEKYSYPTKIMFSSVRYPEHVRQAMLVGVHVCTVPWGVMKRLCDNALTTVGTDQFFEHTRLMTMHVSEVVRERNPVCKLSDTITNAIVEMTESRLGAVTLVDDSGGMAGIFTDGDIRRKLQEKGREILDARMADLDFTKNPVSVSSDALLYEAVNIFKERQIDNIIVLENNIPVGILDIQDLVKLGLVG